MLCESQNRLIELLYVSYTLYGSENRFVELLQASNTLCSGQNILSELIRFALVIMNFTKIYKPPTLNILTFTRLLHALRWSKRTLSIYKPPTHFAEDKTDSPIFYNPPIRLTDVTTDSAKHLKVSYTLCGSQNRLSNFLQASKTLCC